MEIEIRTLQVSKTSWCHEIMSEYKKKISFFSATNIKLIKSEKDFLKSIDEKDFVVVCDERGKALSSRQFAKEFNKIFESGKQKCVFLVGGPFGLPQEVKERADLNLSLSHFVFNQEVALVVLGEQIFRAFTIINNHPYHND